MCDLQASQAGPSTPEEYVRELMKLDFSIELATEEHHGVIDKLRVSLSTNGLRLVCMGQAHCLRSGQ